MSNIAYRNFTSDNILLVTKTYLPQPRPRAILRPALFARLEAGLDCKLTVISAPAGFGKTTLLAAWVERLGRAGGGDAPGWSIAWLSLDRYDNDPLRFWAYLAAAMQTVEASLARAIPAVLLSSSPISSSAAMLSAITAILVNEVSALGRPILLVLDDYHLIQSEAIHASLNDLLDALPPNWRFVVATREDPPLALARRRARGELFELGAADLRFTLNETNELLNTILGLGLSAPDLTSLFHRTEGWAAGLHLAALSLQDRTSNERQAFVSSFAGDDRFIFDYLMNEVFNRLPAQQQDFLLFTSPLERLCAPLCDAIFERRETKMESRAAVTALDSQLSKLRSQDILESLERSNPFLTPLDNHRQWYRVHPLFADLLRTRLVETEGAAALATVQLKASAWHERLGLLPEAVAYALAAGDPEYTAALLERHVLDAFYRSEIPQVSEWLKALPDTILQSHPLLAAVYANTLALMNFSPQAFELAERWLQVAETGLAGSGAASSYIDETKAFMAKFRAYLARFRGAAPLDVIRQAQAALDSLPSSTNRFRSALNFLLGIASMDIGEEETALRAFSLAQHFGEISGDWFNALAAVEVQARLANERGCLRQAASLCRQALDSLVQPQERLGKAPPAAGSVYAVLAALMVEWNELEQADSLLKRGLELLALTTIPESHVFGLFTLARLRCAQGDAPGALEACRSAETRWPHSVSHLAARKARVWLALAEADPACASAVDAWAADHRLNPERAYQLDLEQITLARWLLLRPPLAAALGHPSRPDVIPFLSRQLDAAQRRQRMGWAPEILILQALAFSAQKRTSLALAALKDALSLAETEGYVRLFLEFGRHLAPLLRLAVERGASTGYAAQLLAILEAEAVSSHQHGKEVSLTDQLVDPLTARELDVLRLLAEGLSNRQIAQRLYLSPNTVRIHTSNIYSKLGVSSRTQAAARGRVLGFLD